MTPGHSLLDIVIMGIVEGLTEFLPVSSTGHLILAGKLIGFAGPNDASFEIAIQSGAILAVLVAYWRRFALVLGGLFRGDAQAFKFASNVLLGFLPAAVVGLAVYKGVKALLEAPETGPIVVAVALIVGGVAILAIERLVRRVDVHSVEAMPWRTAALVGVGQCLAMIPGVSRSGATIMGGLLLGLDRKTAAEFSFFLAVPTMIAATGYDLFKNRAGLSADDLEAIGIGFAVSFVVALIVVKGFVRVVSRYGFAPFAWYRIVAGSVALVWLLAL